MLDRIVFVKTGWSETYHGEPVRGRHGYLQTAQGHECYNFKPAQDGRYYGYVPPVGQSSPKPKNRTDWLVMFVAAYRGTGNLTAVGWYEDAAFTVSNQPRPPEFPPDSNGHPFDYCISGDQAHLIQPDRRRQGNIPGDHFR